jgi:hypothetical protein
VLAAVQLYCQSCLATCEIDVEGCYHQLPGEGGAVAGNAVPDCEFRLRGVVAQVAARAVSSRSMRRSMGLA